MCDSYRDGCTLVFSSAMLAFFVVHFMSKIPKNLWSNLEVHFVLGEKVKGERQNCQTLRSCFLIGTFGSETNVLIY